MKVTEQIQAMTPIPDIKEQTTQESETATFAFTIDSPDDVIEQPDAKDENALFNKAIGTIKSAFKVDSSTAKIPKRKFFQKKVDMIAKALIMLSSGLFPETWFDTFEVGGEERQLAPTQKHATDILMPLARIADRHIAVGVDNPDFEDIAASVWALSTYILELRANMKIYQALVQQELRAQQNGYQAHTEVITHTGKAIVLDNLI